MTPSGVLRVGHCIHGLGLGGAQQIVKTIVEKSDRRQFRHFVYCGHDGVRRQEVEQAGATVRIIPRHLSKLDPIWILRLSRAMGQDRVDLVHTHLFGDTLHGYLAASKAKRLPVVMTIHSNHGNFTALQRQGYRWLLSRCDLAVACSPSVRRSFADQDRSLVRKMITISNGIAPWGGHMPDLEERAQLRKSLGLETNGITIAAIGRLDVAKGYQYLLDAFALLTKAQAPVASLVLLGDGPLRASLEARAQTLGLGKKVSIAGFRSDVDRLLPIFDVVVFSSLYEGLSIALLEAMSAARCIVGTTIPGITDVVRHEQEAILAPPRDVPQLASSLQRVAEDPELRLNLGRRAQTRFLAHFTAESMVHQYEQAYCRLVRKEGCDEIHSSRA